MWRGTGTCGGEQGRQEGCQGAETVLRGGGAGGGTLRRVAGLYRDSGAVYKGANIGNQFLF
jgi:hypothetical protein